MASDRQHNTPGTEYNVYSPPAGKAKNVSARLWKEQVSLPSPVHEKVHNDVFAEVVPILERNVYSSDNV